MAERSSPTRLAEETVRDQRRLLFFPRRLFSDPKAYFSGAAMLSARDCDRLLKGHLTVGTVIPLCVFAIGALWNVFHPLPPEADSWSAALTMFGAVVFIGIAAALFLFYAMSAIVWLATRSRRSSAREAWRIASTAVAHTTFADRLYFVWPIYIVLQLYMLSCAFDGARVLADRLGAAGNTVGGGSDDRVSH